MILYCKDSLGCIDNNNIELINNYLLLRDDFRIHRVISPRVDVLARGLITRPIRKSSRNDIFI